MSIRASESGRSPAVPFLVVALLALAVLTGPVRAAEGDPLPFDQPAPEVPSPDIDLEMTEIEAFDAMIEVLDSRGFWPLDEETHFAVLDDLLLEIAVLDHLDAFSQSAPSFVNDIHAAYSPWPDVSRESAVAFLFAVDDGLAELKNEVNRQVGPAPMVAFALDELPIGQRNRLAAGETGKFSVLLPGASLEEATVAAERVRGAVEMARVDGEESQPGGRLTISVGISTLESGDASGLKTRADGALYEAKAQGRNRSVIA